jgi:hypothetical protein
VESISRLFKSVKIPSLIRIGTRVGLIAPEEASSSQDFFFLLNAIFALSETRVN